MGCALLSGPQVSSFPPLSLDGPATVRVPDDGRTAFIRGAFPCWPPQGWLLVPDQSTREMSHAQQLPPRVHPLSFLKTELLPSASVNPGVVWLQGTGTGSRGCHPQAAVQVTLCHLWFGAQGPCPHGPPRSRPALAVGPSLTQMSPPGFLPRSHRKRPLFQMGPCSEVLGGRELREPPLDTLRGVVQVPVNVWLFRLYREHCCFTLSFCTFVPQ